MIETYVMNATIYICVCTYVKKHERKREREREKEKKQTNISNDKEQNNFQGVFDSFCFSVQLCAAKCESATKFEKEKEEY